MVAGSLPELELIEFLNELSYLRGYKAAVFDSKIRFSNEDSETVEKWERERLALDELSSFVTSQIGPGITLGQMSERLKTRVQDRRKLLGSGSTQYAADLYETERALGMIENLQRVKEAA